jgi:hypothetical protein
MVVGSSDVVVPPFSVRPHDKGKVMFRTISATALAAVVLTVPAPARAADPTISDCLGANESSIALRSQQKLRAARAQLLVCASAACPADVRNECTRRFGEVNAAMPTIVFDAKDVTGRDLSAVKVSMDGQVLAERLAGNALSIDPGEHTFTFEVAGQPKVEKQFVINEGEKARRERITFSATPTPTPAPVAPTAAPVAPAPAPVAPPPAPAAIAPMTAATQTEPDSLRTGPGAGFGPQKIAAVFVAGVGVVGLGIGTVFGLQAMSKRSDASRVCPDECADQSGADLWKNAKTAGNVSTVGFIVGGVGLAAGAALWFTAKPTASTQVGIGPGSIELKGSW